MNDNTDIFDRQLCELEEEINPGDTPIECTEVASSTIMSGDLKGSLVCVVHSCRLKDDGYEIIDELIYED